MAITTQMRTDVAGLYAALFARAPERDGLGYWVSQLDTGKSVAQIAQDMYNVDAARVTYPKFLTNQEIIGKFYTNVLGRAADTDGLNYWTGKLNAGATPGSVITDMITAVKSYAGTDAAALSSQSLFNNKVSVGLNYAVTLGLNDVAKAADVLALVTATDTTAANNLAAGTSTTGQSYTLTTGVDNITGSAAGDTFTAIIDNFGAAATTTAGARTTLSLGDAIDGSTGVDTLNIVTNLTGGTTIPVTTLKNIEIINVNNAAPLAADVVTIAASGAPQATQFNATGSGSLTVTGIGSAAIGSNGVAAQTAANVTTITAAGANTINIQNTTTAAAAAGTIKFDVSGGAGAGAQAVVVNTLGTTANVINDIKIGNAVVGAASLTINAASNLKTTTITEAVANTLKTVTISGAATTVDLGALPSTGLTSVDASGLTAGGAKVTLGTNLATTFKGGAGNDTVGVVAGAVVTGAIDAGTGTDTLSLSTAASLTAATGKLFTNFETLQVSNAGLVGTTETYDPTLLSGITSYKVAASSGAVALINLAAAPAVTVTGNVAGTAGIALTLKDATGTSDVVNITLDNGKTDATAVNNGLTVSKLTAANVETINIHSNGLVSGAGATANTITANDVAANLTLSKVVIDGSQAFSFATGNNAVVLTVDASAATGNGTIDATGATKLVNINGGLGNDTLTAGGAGGLVAGGKGGDAVTLGAGTDTLVFKAASDSVQDFAGVAGVAGKGTMDTVASFTTGTDKIDLTSLNFTTATTKVFVDKTFADVTALQTAEATAAFFQDATNITRGAVVAHIGADSYLVVDADHSGTFAAANDLVVKLTATAALVQTDVIWG